MPEINVSGARLHYTDTGSGDETILFLHGLLMDSTMFDDQVAHFSKHYHCIALDYRGHGQSEITRDGYDMDSLTEEVTKVIRKLGIGPCHLAGLSMGGFIGLRMAMWHPDLVRSLILMDTTADPEPKENVGPYNRLVFVAKWFGVRPVAKKIMPVMFGQSFLTDPALAEKRQAWQEKLASANRLGRIRATRAVVTREGVYNQIHQIKTPTLILVGEEDVATVPEKSERIQGKIKGSILKRIPRAGHSSSVENPAAINQEMENFLNGLHKEQSHAAE